MKLENYYNPDYAGLQQYPLNLTEVELLHNLIKEKNDINLSAVEHYYNNNKAVIDESFDGKLMEQLSQYVTDIRVLKGIKYLLYRYNVDTEYIDTTQRITYDENSIGIIDMETYFHVNVVHIIPSYNLIGEELLSSIIARLSVWRYVDSYRDMSFTKLLINAMIDVHRLTERKRLTRVYQIEDIFDLVYWSYNLNIEDSERIYKETLYSRWNDNRSVTGISVPKAMKYQTVLSELRKKYVELHFNATKTIKENLKHINLEIDKDYPDYTCLQMSERTLKSIIGGSDMIKCIKSLNKEIVETKKMSGLSKKEQREWIVKIYQALKEDGYTMDEIIERLKKRGYKVTRRTLYRWTSDV